MSRPPLFFLEQPSNPSVRNRRPWRRVIWVTVAFAWLAVSAWWGVIRPIKFGIQTSAHLSNCVLLYREFETAFRRPPASLDEFEEFLNSERSLTSRQKYGEIPLALDLIRNGRFVIIWNGSVGTQYSGNNIFGYDEDVPTSGGRVLYADGRLHKMTVVEFGWARMVPAAPTALSY